MRTMMRFTVMVLMGLSTGNVCAFGWQDLWFTPDQQAQSLMKNHQFASAQSLFQQPDWRAAAAYRAGDYKQSASLYETLHNESGYYNQGNALARLGKYKDAITAYDKALSINPANKDALYNRKLVAALLQKQDNNEKQSGDSDSKDKKNNNQQNQQNQQNQEAKEGQSPNQDEQNTENQPDKNTGSAPEISVKDKQQRTNEDKKDQPSPAINSQEDQENKQAKEQWLKLIPDDPGGLLRQKFLRDHLRHQAGGQWQ